jgi:hypothetical protein
MSFLPYSILHALVAIVTSAKDCLWCKHNNTTIKQSQTIAVQDWKSCLQLTTLNLNHFKMVEDMGLKIIASRSTWMTVRKLLVGDRQTDWWSDKHTFIFGKQAKKYFVAIFKVVPDRPLVRVPIRTLLEYSYELGVWDFDPLHILILIEVWC